MRMKLRSPRTYRRNRQGFSITEVAIVLGVVATILVAIWAYATGAYENARQQQLKEELSTVVNNIHTMYLAQVNISGSIAAVMPSLISHDVMPGTMVRNGGGCANGPPTLCADSPWGSAANLASGTFAICAWALGPGANANCATAGNSAAAQFFAIELSGLPQASCVTAVLNNSGPGGPPGLSDVAISGATPSGLSAIKAGSPLPVSQAFATTNCTAGATVDFIYRLRASTF